MSGKVARVLEGGQKERPVFVPCTLGRKSSGSRMCIEVLKDHL